MQLETIMRQSQPGPIRVTDQQYRLLDANGDYFFWCGDTAWNLFASLDLDEARRFLTLRAQQGFNVIQAVGYFEHDCRKRPAHMGQWAMHDQDPAKPNDAYFDHVEKVMNIADSVGLHIAFVPTWGHLVSPMWAGGDPLFTAEKARIYGEYVGKRFGGRKNLIWVNGGDRPVNSVAELEIWRNLAQGIRSTESIRHLMTFHTCGFRCSSEFVHDEPWLDMNMQQSGHGRLLDRVDQRIANTLSLTPAKPVLDGEICYEDHPVSFRAANGRFGAWDVRVAAYRCVFSGGCGVTYGASAIWQFFSDRYPVIMGSVPSMDWKQSMYLPGAAQMGYLRQLMERFADKSLHPCGSIYNQSDYDGEAACTLRDGTIGEPNALCMLAYLPVVSHLYQFDLSQMGRDEICATFFDPRTGKTEPAGVYQRGKQVQLKAMPHHGRDWVLIFEVL
ncbi:MAG: hypothetical protein CMJ19_11910 [Phycisphaeraceae bacterium]|nr:hypothetical protein [Phycisphaeraceae bacterium]